MDALGTLGVCRMGIGQADEAIALLRQSMAMAREDGEGYQFSRAYLNLSDILHLMGRTREAYNLLHQGLGEMELMGHKGLWLHLQLSEMAFNLGLWDEADEHSPPELAPRHDGMSLVFYETRRAELELGRGQHERARARLERARALVKRSFEPQWHGPITALLAGLERRERNIDAARDVIATGMRRLHDSDALQDGARLARILSSAAGVEADAAQQARDLGRPDDEAAAISAAAELAARTAEAAALPSAQAIPEAGAYALVARAEATAATGTPDPEQWRAAAEAWEALERPYRAARNRWREAEARLQLGDRAGAEAVGGQALAGARRLGAAWLVAELVALGRRGRLRFDEEPGALPEAGVAAAADHALPDPAAELGLTPRERDVLLLVAQGATNREIGERLYMAEKTASVHVSRILAKLDVRTRTEAAAVAHRLGLQQPGDAPVAAA
jgi:DNA-binding CsgD family transcriptional regulator/tetratricopeptide (TPR) repeat protein